ncbi:universal stress protein [Cognatilysobacter lacus]|uniref:Universal stress protein n=1 Tax=Cognatilysobacter lacus TaxID=1643323 RepID=A0A5D8Z5T9_9GAMM|nr:universal stress protein [Lysobacter lacus]TZF90020.1 universal stress protein [Lysobacter lacus]
MYRDVMLAITETDHDARAIKAAVEFCRVNDARLSVSVPFDMMQAQMQAFGTTPIVLEESYVELRKDAVAHVARLRTQLQKEDVRFDVHIAEAQVHASRQLLALEARYHDIVIVAAPGPHDSTSAALHTIFSTLVVDSGRPVMAIPNEGRATFPPQCVLIGWQPTPEATRAVHDALPLLKQAKRVEIALAAPQVGETRHGQEPGADIAAHLARHGVGVNVRVDRLSRGPSGNDLLLVAEECGADLIIVGAYGHSRAREWAFGGVTRDLLERARVPVLYSH